MNTSPNHLFKSRSAVSFAFFINGIVFACWAAHIPSIQEKFDLSEADLGNILLLMGMGAVSVMAFTGWLVQKIGSRIVTIVSSCLYAISLPFIFFAPEPLCLGIAVFLFGAGGGSMDVSMNDQAVMVEKQYQQPIMSSFHALFSLGGLLGAALASVVLKLNGTPLQQAILTMCALLLCALVLFPHLLSHQPSPKATGQQQKQWTIQPLLALLACLTFIVFMSEGVIADWSALYMKDVVGVDKATAALAFAAFSLSMTLGRFSGDYLVARFGGDKLLLVGGLLFISGMLLVLSQPGASWALLGFVLVGAGLSNLVPITFSRAGNLDQVSASVGIATVSVVGYTGFLLGPPIMGTLAEHFSLSGAFNLLLVFGLLICLSSRGLKN